MSNNGNSNYQLIYAPEGRENLVDFLMRHLGFEKYKNSENLIVKITEKIKNVDIKDNSQKMEAINWLLDQIDGSKSLSDKIFGYYALFGDQDIESSNEWTQKSLSDNEVF